MLVPTLLYTKVFLQEHFSHRYAVPSWDNIATIGVTWACCSQSGVRKAFTEPADATWMW